MNWNDGRMAKATRQIFPRGARDAWQTPSHKPSNLSRDSLQVGPAGVTTGVGRRARGGLAYLWMRLALGRSSCVRFADWTHEVCGESGRLLRVTGNASPGFCPPECLTLSSGQDVKSCFWTWLCPAPWFPFLVSVPILCSLLFFWLEQSSRKPQK